MNNELIIESLLFVLSQPLKQSDLKKIFNNGDTPSLEDIEDVHSFIKNINRKYENFKLLYGGSVKASNSADINNLVNVDGCLIGGSSLITEEFNSIIS